MSSSAAHNWADRTHVGPDAAASPGVTRPPLSAQGVVSTDVLAHRAGARAVWPAGLQLKSQAEAQQFHKDLAKQKQKADGMNGGQQPVGVVAPDETVLQLRAMSIECKSLTPWEMLAA